MKNNTYKLLRDEFGIAESILDLIDESEKQVSSHFSKLDDTMAYNQYKVLEAFQRNNIRDMHFSWNTGYGYDDPGRDAVERVYADIFHTEAALVRPTIVNGTHALTLTLMGILRPGDEMIYCTGGPYDTLEEVIGLRGEGKGSLKEYGISYKQVELTPEGSIDYDALQRAIGPATRMVCLQRATGYAWRKAISIEEIRECTAFVKNIDPNIICMADNCYGEFLHIQEPTDAGIDVMAGSLIKNPGGGLALSGGYIVGRSDLIERISYRLTCPGIGAECGLTFGQNRSVLQGMFLAPKVVNAAVKGAMLCGAAYDGLGFEVMPPAYSKRSDIVQAIQFKDPDKTIAFCQAIQSASPIDAYVTPIPWDMPGYEDQVIMAAGAFVQGSSIELSADAPLREPYIAYFQGGLTYEHARYGIIKSLDTMVKKGLIDVEEER